jgi:hypothetical protein
MGDVVFAWWPVPLSEFRKPYWYATGKCAWLRKVRRVKTYWHDTFYTEIPK